MLNCNSENRIIAKNAHNILVEIFVDLRHNHESKLGTTTIPSPAGPRGPWSKDSRIRFPSETTTGKEKQRHQFCQLDKKFPPFFLRPMGSGKLSAVLKLASR